MKDGWSTDTDNTLRVGEVRTLAVRVGTRVGGEQRQRRELRCGRIGIKTRRMKLALLPESSSSRASKMPRSSTIFAASRAGLLIFFFLWCFSSQRTTLKLYTVVSLEGDAISLSYLENCFINTENEAKGRAGNGDVGAVACSAWGGYGVCRIAAHPRKIPGCKCRSHRVDGRCVGNASWRLCVVAAT